MSSSDDDDGIGPKIPFKRVRVVEQITELNGTDILQKLGLPTAEMYENSFMHQSVVSRVFASVSTNFIVTVSNADGVVKFWKKAPIGIEFVKTVFCESVIVDSALSLDGCEFAVIAQDNKLRVFDVALFSLTSVVKLEKNGCETICAISHSNFAISYNSGVISVSGKSVFSRHSHPITNLGFDQSDSLVSIDSSGLIEVWSPETLGLPRTARFASKLDTDLFVLKKRKSTCNGLAVGREKFAIITSDSSLLVFNLFTCRIENELQIAIGKDRAGLCFDNLGRVLIVPTPSGIHLYDTCSTGMPLLSVLGKVESSERFVDVCLFQGAALREAKMLTGSGGNDEAFDPTIIATAENKNRFYLFSNRLPGENRDIFNEQQLGSSGIKSIAVPIRRQLPTTCTIHTTMGDIELSLLPLLAPKAVENFAALASNFEDVIFHRVVKGFMIQTGDTGGSSIWNKEFGDEISSSVKFNKPFVLAMANHGPNTNNTQFFITTVPTPWLDGKHTIFGSVTNGFDVVHAIENVEVDANDRPKTQDVKILTIRI